MRARGDFLTKESRCDKRLPSARDWEGSLMEPPRLITGNRILDALPVHESARLRSRLESVPLALRQVVHRPGDKITSIYFPLKGALSVITLLRDGSSIEVGTVGHEGLLGLSALLADGISLHEVVVQGAGSALRGSAAFIRQEVERSDALRRIVLQLSQFVVAEISQNAACNGRHALRERSARWLLRMRDTLDADEFPLSQEFLSTMLGVQRTAVTGAAQELRHKRLIQYRHGRIAILDVAGLNAAACECYEIMKDARDRLFRD
jgi:CRP-like cAMP-binding protein